MANGRPPYPPEDRARQMADDISAFLEMYPLMWVTTADKLRDGAESLRWQIKHGYVRSQSGRADA